MGQLKLAQNQDYSTDLQTIKIIMVEKSDCLNHKINRILDNIDYKLN